MNEIEPFPELKSLPAARTEDPNDNTPLISKNQRTVPQMLLKPELPGAPAFAIAGQVPSRFLGTECFQETHPERIFRDCSHYCEAAYTAVQAATMSRLSLQTAITKRCWFGLLSG